MSPTCAKRWKIFLSRSGIGRSNFLIFIGWVGLILGLSEKIKRKTCENLYIHWLIIMFPIGITIGPKLPWSRPSLRLSCWSLPIHRTTSMSLWVYEVLLPPGRHNTQLFKSHPATWSLWNFWKCHAEDQNHLTSSRFLCICMYIKVYWFYYLLA